MNRPICHCRLLLHMQQKFVALVHGPDACAKTERGLSMKLLITNVCPLILKEIKAGSRPRLRSAKGFWT